MIATTASVYRSMTYKATKHVLFLPAVKSSYNVRESRYMMRIFFANKVVQCELTTQYVT